MNTLKAALLGTALTALGAGTVFAQTVELPPNAKAGECYARVLVPAQYAERSEKVLVSPASKKIETTEAQFDVVEKRVLVEEASEKLEVVPAVFEMVEETVIVKEASENLVSVPASFTTVEEKVLVKPAYTTWKKGRGPIEQIDSATGEIMCLIEVPAEYKTVKKRVLQAPATTKKESMPAVTKTIKVKKMVQPPKTRTITIPAKYETVSVRKLVSPAREVVTEIPAEYSTVTKSSKISDGRVEWRSILCETNVGVGIVTRIQRALQSKGYNPGKIDGVLGGSTMLAIDRYQRASGLATGQLTMQTIKALGVSL